MNFKAKICPFCKKNNNCQVLKASSCWCMKSKIPDGLKQLLAKEDKMKLCICQVCVEEYKKDSISFKDRYNFK